MIGGFVALQRIPRRQRERFAVASPIFAAATATVCVDGGCDTKNAAMAAAMRSLAAIVDLDVL